MRIEHFQLDGDISREKGIENIDMNRLGSVVALVGKNGAGKTRVLDLLESQYFDSAVIAILEGRIVNLPEQIVKFLDPYQPIKGYTNLWAKLQILQKNKNLSNAAIRHEVQRELQKIAIDNQLNPKESKLIQEFNSHYPSFEEQIRKILPRYIKRIKNSDVINLKEKIEGTPTAKFLSFEKIIEQVTEVDQYDELNSIYSSSLKYLRELPDELVADFHESMGNEKKFHATKAYKRYLSLQKYFSAFLGKELELDQLTSDRKRAEGGGINVTHKGNWKLNGRPFNYKQFSEGEKTLLGYCLLFFLLDQNPKVSIKESIIIIDEPELHLHPESEIKIIEAIREVIENSGQLWIATHSISILSHLNYDEIFMIKNGTITPPSKTTPGNTLNELMGLESQREKLTSFIYDISDWAFVNFMTQTFLEPDVIESARANDPEVELFKRALKNSQPGETFLDFGAGQGRLFKEFNEEDELKNKLAYYALEPNSKNSEALKSLNINIKHVFNNHSELNDSTFNYILLCGVLHEIKLTEWAVTLNKIISALKENGFLIIIEDTKIPKGEKIDDVGFIILNSEAIKSLFSMTKIPSRIISNDSKYKDRILCHVISKKEMRAVTNDTIFDALSEVNDYSVNEIIELRKTKITADNKHSLGRLAAFYSQLNINSLLGFKKLESLKSKEVDDIMKLEDPSRLPGESKN